MKLLLAGAVTASVALVAAAAATDPTSEDASDALTVSATPEPVYQRLSAEQSEIGRFTAHDASGLAEGHVIAVLEHVDGGPEAVTICWHGPLGEVRGTMEHGRPFLRVDAMSQRLIAMHSWEELAPALGPSPDRDHAASVNLASGA